MAELIRLASGPGQDLAPGAAESPRSPAEPNRKVTYMRMLSRSLEAMARWGARLRSGLRRALGVQPLVQPFTGAEFPWRVWVSPVDARPPEPCIDSSPGGSKAVSAAAVGRALLRRVRAFSRLSDDPASLERAGFVAPVPGGVGGIGGSLELSSDLLTNELRSGLKVPPDPTLPPHITALPRVGRAR